MGPIDSVPGIAKPKPIGSGGFGTVFRANDAELNRDVAVKLLDLKPDGQSLNAYKRETDILARLSTHPNIVTLYKAGVAEGGYPYMVMEHATGGSLDDILNSEGRFGWPEVCSIGEKICEAVQTAHDKMVVHRDIKPANILVSEYGEPLLSDFGIATLTDRTRTQSRKMTATVAHASPEHLGGLDVDSRTDVYSIGSTLYELLVGHPAFFPPSDENWMAALPRIASEDPPPLDPSIPADVASEIVKAMANTRTTDIRRPQNWELLFQLPVAQTNSQQTRLQLDWSNRQQPLPVPFHPLSSIARLSLGKMLSGPPLLQRFTALSSQISLPAKSSWDSGCSRSTSWPISPSFSARWRCSDATNQDRTRIWWACFRRLAMRVRVRNWRVSWLLRSACWRYG